MKKEMESKKEDMEEEEGTCPTCGHKMKGKKKSSLMKELNKS